jgi:hypothetical protein
VDGSVNVSVNISVNATHTFCIKIGDIMSFPIVFPLRRYLPAMRAHADRGTRQAGGTRLLRAQRRAGNAQGRERKTERRGPVNRDHELPGCVSAEKVLPCDARAHNEQSCCIALLLLLLLLLMLRLLHRTLSVTGASLEGLWTRSESTLRRLTRRHKSNRKQPKVTEITETGTCRSSSRGGTTT